MFTPEQIRSIENRLEERAVGRMATCQLCHKTAGYSIAEGFVFFTMQGLVDRLQMTGPGIPLVPLTCRHCGSTYFVNLVVLGLQDIIQTHAAVQRPLTVPEAFREELAHAA